MVRHYRIDAEEVRRGGDPLNGAGSTQLRRHILAGRAIVELIGVAGKLGVHKAADIDIAFFLLSRRYKISFLQAHGRLESCIEAADRGVRVLDFG